MVKSQHQNQHENECESVDSQSTFSYEQLKAKSENPVTGIDFKRREVCFFIRFIPLSSVFYFLLWLTECCLGLSLCWRIWGSSRSDKRGVLQNTEVEARHDEEESWSVLGIEMRANDKI